MDPATIALLASLGIQVGSAIFNEIANANDKDEQRRMVQRVLQDFRDTELPNIQQLNAEELGDTAFAGLESDADLRQTRDMELEALDSLKQRYGSGRLGLEDRALQNEALMASSADASAAHNRIQADMDARGAGRGGTAVALQLANAQGAANRAANIGARTAGAAQSRAYDSILARGRLAGEMRDRDTSLKSNVASARDSISRYNAAGRDRANAYNAGIPQQQFDNRMRKNAGVSNATNGVVNQYDRQISDNNAFAGGIGAAGAEAGQTYYRSRKKKGGGAY